jgi:hypothetical protein
MESSTLQYSATFDTLNAPSQSAVAAPEKVTAASQAVIDAAMGVAPEIDAPRENHVLLAHGIKRDGALIRDAEVRELDGEDEEALAKAGPNWIRFLDTVVSRGTVSIGNVTMTKDIADELLVGDREDLVLAVRRATFGPTLEITEHVCPQCQSKSALKIHLDSIPHVELDDPEDVRRLIELRGGHIAEVRFVNGGDQKAVYADPEATVAQTNTLLLARCITSFDGASVEPGGRAVALVKKLGIADRKKILKHLFDNAPGPRFDKIEYTHDACGSVIKLPLGLADMFLWL